MCEKCNWMYVSAACDIQYVVLSAWLRKSKHQPNYLSNQTINCVAICSGRLWASCLEVVLADQN